MLYVFYHKTKRYIATSAWPNRLLLLILGEWWLMRRVQQPQWSHDTKVISGIKTLYRYFYKAHGYQTTQGGGLLYWATTYKLTLFFDYVIICSLMTNKNRYISNCTSLMGTKPDWVVAYDIKPPVKSHITLSKKFLFSYFFLSQQCTLNLTWDY